MLRSHWVMLVMDVFTRRIIGFGVAPAYLDGVSVCRMFNYATADQPGPKHLSTDHDPLFRFHRWLANLRVLDIEEVKSIAYVPVSHPFVERLIGRFGASILIGCSFGTRSTWRRSWTNSATITMPIACTARLTVQRQRNAPEHHPLSKLRSIKMPGYSSVAVSFGRRWQRECEFSTHKRSRDGRTAP